MSKIHRQIVTDYTGIREFKDREDLDAYAPVLLDLPEIAAHIEATNDRFEEQLLRSTRVRDEVRSGVRVTDEKIEVTIYEWIQRFLSLTHRYDVIEHVKVSGIAGSLEIDLFRKSVQFVPLSSRIIA